MVMKEIEDKASLLGIDLSTIDLDSIHFPPGEDCGIPRYVYISNYSFLGLWPR